MASSLKSLPRLLPRATRTTTPTVASSSRTVPLSSILHSTPRIPQIQNQNALNSNTSRAFTSSTLRARAKTMGQLRARNSTGPFSWKAALLFVVTGAGMIVYFQVEKERLARKRVAEMSKGVGRPKVGGPFVLRDLEGREFTAEDLKGKYSFVRCPSRYTWSWGLLVDADYMAMGRSTSDSRIAPISARTNLTKWPRSSTRSTRRLATRASSCLCLSPAILFAIPPRSCASI